MNDIDELIAAMPPPKVRRRASKAPEVIQTIVSLAQRGFPLSAISGACGVPYKTLQAWTRGRGDLAVELRAAIETGRQLERELARQRYMAGQRNISRLMQSMAVRAA